ncbi:hypothetical protein [Streptomyces sp. NPDC059656]|uniref:hypothetical protein n=1 Tax=Streptomyces sp. NPDC059656 TaxID=3346898 RepID=UPI0036A39637
MTSRQAATPPAVPGQTARAAPARLRGTASQTSRGGVVRHGVPQARVGEECVCTWHDCGGLVPVLWCD